MDKFSYISNADTSSVDSLYQAYLEDPESVDYGWQKFFEGFEVPLALKRNILDLIFFKQKNEKVSSFKNLFDRIGIVLLEFKKDNQRNLYIDNTKLFKI